MRDSATIRKLCSHKVSGMPFFKFLHDRILYRLEMQNAMNVDALGPSVQATGYMRHAMGPLRPTLPTGRGWLSGAGELWMTDSDLAKWDIAMMNESLMKPASYNVRRITARPVRSRLGEHRCLRPGRL